MNIGVYPAGSRFNALCERVNGLTIWAKCRDHPEYWTDFDATKVFYGELNWAATLLVDWHKDHADWRMDEAERSFEKAERLWDAERGRVSKLRIERDSPVYKGLAARLRKLPIIEDGEGGAFDALNTAYRVLESFDYHGAEVAVEEAERKAKALVQRLPLEHYGHKYI